MDRNIMVCVFVIAMLLGGIYCVVDNFIHPIAEAIIEYEEATPPVIEERPIEIEYTKDIKETKDMWITCYCLTENSMASGLPVGIGACAVDTELYDMGTLFRVHGLEAYLLALDTGRLVKGNHLDMWLPDCEVCLSITGNYKVDIY